MALPQLQPVIPWRWPQCPVVTCQTAGWPQYSVGIHHPPSCPPAPPPENSSGTHVNAVDVSFKTIFPFFAICPCHFGPPNKLISLSLASS